MESCWPLPRIRYAPLSAVNESRNVSLFYSAGIREAVSGKLSLVPVSEIEVTEATLEYWDTLSEFVEGDVIYAVGGGLVVDAAKYVAVKKGLPLVGIPTAISVDAFLTWASGYRQDGCVKYLETKPPEDVVVDLDLIACGPRTLRAAGITDVLSIATGRFDWKLAEGRGKNPDGMAYDAAVDGMIERILDAALACAPRAGRAEPEGLRRLFECLAMEVQLCNLIGHSRPEEGSEHYFAYAAEEVLGKGLPHGDLVGPGILVAATLQGQDTAPLEIAMRACNVPLDRIPEETVRDILRSLPDYCGKHNLPYGIAHELDESMINALDLGLLYRGEGVS
jgi:glycerol-1-phosphate dehydrogenase [NAD(P)+]